MRQIAVASLLLVIGMPAPSLFAQLRASEEASVSQTVDGTTITVDYSRPRARGRKGLFGSRIHAGETWTPGANQATTLRLNRDVTIEATAVPKGKYSVWIVAEPSQWLMLLDRDTTLFHTERPRARAGQIRFPIKREKRPFLEVLTWSFPEVRSSGVTLAMQWDTVYVPLTVGVAPSFSTAATPEVGNRIAGVYQMQVSPPPLRNDSTLAPGEKPATDVKLTIGKDLHAVMDPPMYRSEGGYTDWVLIPLKDGWFHLGRMQDGEIIEVLDFVQLQFDQTGDRAQGFEVRLRNDMLVGKGTRVK